LSPDHLRKSSRSSPAKWKQHLYIDGRITIQRFLKAKLIDELTITVIPILLGNVISLFGNGGIEQQLELIEISTSEKGSSIQRRCRVNRLQ